MKKLFLSLIIITVMIFINSKSAEASTFLLSMEAPDPNYKGTKMTLDSKNRKYLEELVMGEAGGEGYIGAALVAQCIRDYMVKDNTKDVKKIKENHKFDAALGTTPNEDVKKAVKFIFDEGGSAIQHRVLYYYAAKPIFGSTGSQYLTSRSGNKVWKDVTDPSTYPFHEKGDTEYLITYNNHKFFDELSTSATKDFAIANKRKGYNLIIYSENYAWDMVANKRVTKEEAISMFDSAVISNNASATNSIEGTEQSAIDIVWGGNEYNSLGNFVVDVAGLEGLTFDERMRIEVFKEDMNSTELPLYRGIRVSFLVFGIFVIVYSALLFFAYWFDRLDILFGISLLSKLTANKLVVSPDEESKIDKVDNMRCIDLGRAITILVMGVILGSGFILTGNAFKLIQFFMNVYEKIISLM